MNRPVSAPRALSLAVITMLLASSPTAFAQASPDASAAPTPFVPGGMCVLGSSEVGEILGRPGEYAAELDTDGCTYTGQDAYLALDWRSWYDLEHEPDAAGEDVTIAGFPGWYNATSYTVYIDTGYRTYGIHATFDGTGATMEQLRPAAEVVLPRFVAADTTSAAFALPGMFPAQLGGEPVDVSLAMSGPEWLGDMSDEQRAQVEALLAAQGATAADLGIASGGTDGGAQMSAIRIIGASAAEFAAPLLGIAAGGDEELTITPTSVAGREVLVASVPSEESTIVVYPSGEVAWLLMLEDAILAEALGALP